jgi:hypothetical protein
MRIKSLSYAVFLNAGADSCGLKVRSEGMTDSRTLGCIGIVGVVIFLLVVLALHVLQPSLNARDEAVSYYVHGRFGWLLTVGLIALGIGSVCLAFGLAHTVEGRWAAIGRWLLGIWGLGVLLGGLFSADPPGHWNEPPSLAGMIHGNAAILAFVALPLGAFCLWRAFHQDERWRCEGNFFLGLALAAAISLILFMASLIPVFVRPGPPILLGLSERVLLVVYAAWLIAIGLGVMRARIKN